MKILTDKIVKIHCPVRNTAPIEFIRIEYSDGSGYWTTRGGAVFDTEALKLEEAYQKLINKPVTYANEQPKSSEIIEQQISLLRELDARWGMDGSNPTVLHCIEVLRKGRVD